jgi:hypothetical protein
MTAWSSECRAVGPLLRLRTVKQEAKLLRLFCLNSPGFAHFTVCVSRVNVLSMGHFLGRYWGVLALLAAVACWVGVVLGKVTTAIVGLVLVLSVAALLYFLFQAPLWCGAVTRDGLLCRNNSSGLLIGCHLREHKWQKIKMTFVPKAWRKLNRGLWATPKEGVNTLAGLGSAVSALAALITILIVKH